MLGDHTIPVPVRMYVQRYQVVAGFVCNEGLEKRAVGVEKRFDHDMASGF